MTPKCLPHFRNTSVQKAVLVAASLLALSTVGCQYLGAILDKFDNSPTPAEYKPTREDMLILVEDSRNPDLIGTLGDRVMSDVADDLTKHKVDQLIDSRKVITFHADVTSVTVTAPIGSGTAKGILTADVKIIDAQTGDTRWPQDAGARTITVETPTLPLKGDGSLEPLYDYIVDRLSQQIAELFYDHPKTEETQPEEINNY
jgi:hypothetical protein